MIAIPAVDLRGGACVQLVGGSYEAERVRLDDPLQVARAWGRHGFTRLHVVDLDAATGRGTNRDVIDALVREPELVTQVGGGVRSDEQIEALLRDGAQFVVVGTRALEDTDWAGDVAEAFPGRVIVAADVRERRVVTHGWTRTLPHHVIDVVEELGALPLAAILVTAVHKEGLMAGPDFALMEDVVEVSAVPVHASGGIGSMRDLHLLADCGVGGAVLGMALYTGALDAWAVAEEFGR